MAEEYLMHLSFKEIIGITLIVITSIITLYAFLCIDYYQIPFMIKQNLKLVKQY